MPPELPTPAHLFRQFEQGRITRSEFQAAMRLHQLLLIDDIHDAMRDPGLSWFDEVLNRRAARRLIKQHGEDIIRETLAALAELPDFPPAIHIWNAGHRLVPLYCFLRMKRAPFGGWHRRTMFPARRAGLQAGRWRHLGGAHNSGSAAPRR